MTDVRQHQPAPGRTSGIGEDGHNRAARPDLLRWDRPVGTRVTQLSDAERRCERALFICLVAVRTVHLVQAGDTAAVAWSSYRRPLLDLALIVAAIVESLWVLDRFWTRRAVDDRAAALVDVGFGVVALAAMVAITTTTDRTAWVNWACPFTYGTVAIAFMVLRPRYSLAVTVALAATYFATVAGTVRAGGSLFATALANTVTYGGVYVAGRVFVGLLRRSAHDVDSARAQAVERGARLAAERERNRNYRLVHDSALQTLEAVAKSGGRLDEAVRRQAKVDATRLRQTLRGQESAAGSLAAGLESLVVEFAGYGIHVELVPFGLAAAVPARTVAAFRDATREALTNVRKHAGVRSVVVSAREVGDEVEVVIRDQGRGFHLSQTPMGFGVGQSIEARMSEVGGCAQVWSETGRGTRVVLRASA